MYDVGVVSIQAWSLARLGLCRAGFVLGGVGNAGSGVEIYLSIHIEACHILSKAGHCILNYL